MAAREGQGMKIAVIIFAFLTIVLATTTFMFYAQSQTAYKEKTDAQNARQQAEQENSKLKYRLAAMNYVLGVKDVTKQEVEIAKGAAGQDADAEKILADYEADMALLGDQAAPGGGAKNYRTMGTILLAALNSRNLSVANANEQTRKAREEQEATAKAEAARAEQAVAFRDKAASELNSERDANIAARELMEKQNAKLQETLTSVRTTAQSDLEKISQEAKSAKTQAANQQNTITVLRDRIKADENEKVSLFERPDGQVERVSQSQRLVWINVGRVDGLLRQTTFAVYDHNENGVADSKPKAKIEVVNLGDKLSEARILDDSAANPIIRGDVIHTIAWSPGQRIHFALAGKMDVNGDGIDDYELVRNVIRINGGEIDAELRPDGKRSGKVDVNTRYLVRGDVESTKELIDEYAKMKTEVEQFGTDIRSVKDILALMGWKADERIVDLGGSKGGDFRKRQPGKTEPAAPASPGATTPATPSTESPAPATTDPFGAPAADPFGAPAATPKAPATPEVDPFK
jgi:hypothetical protein